MVGQNNFNNDANLGQNNFSSNEFSGISSINSNNKLQNNNQNNNNNNKPSTDSGDKKLNNRSNSCTKLSEKINNVIMGTSDKIDCNDLEISIIGAKNDGHVSYHVKTLYNDQVYNVFRSVNDFQELQVSLQKLFPKLLIPENTSSYVQNIN